MNTSYEPLEHRKEEIWMMEQVNPGHPDKLADRIAGAITEIHS